MSPEIKNLKDLLEPYLKNGQKLLSYECKNLLSSGENYGSVMVQVTAKILNGNGQEESLHCVGKMTPPSEMLWDLFKTKFTFKKEIAIYNVMVPSLNAYGKEKGIDRLIDFLAEPMGARISLDPKSDVVDKDAILLLENLKVQGYEIGDRFNGFDEECSKFLLNDLAVLHAAVIGYKSAHPEKFKAKFLPYLNKDYVFFMEEEVIGGFAKAIQDAVTKNPKCIPYLSKIEEGLRKLKYFVENPPEGKKIFTTLTHNDYWVNNTMIKCDQNGKPLKNKMVDFQIIEHSSLAHDVIFFLYSSVSMDVLERQIDDLIRFYYEKFVETLVKLQCDVSEYTFEAMMEEFNLVAGDAQFSHLLYMLPPIHTLKGKAKELSEFKLEDLIFQESSLHQNYFRRMQFVLLDFVKRGWI